MDKLPFYYRFQILIRPSIAPLPFELDRSLHLVYTKRRAWITRSRKIYPIRSIVEILLLRLLVGYLFVYIMDYASETSKKITRV